MTKRAQDIKVGDRIRNHGEVIEVVEVTRKAVDVFRIVFSDNTFRTCSWGAVFTVEG